MPSFVLRNGNVPPGLAVDAEGRTSVDIAIAEGRIGAIRRPSGVVEPGERDRPFQGSAWGWAA